MAQKIIIDTDPGVDDALAIQFALHSQEFEIIGLTTVFGNVNVDVATENALRLLHLSGRYDIAVAKGAANPLKSSFGGGVPFVHGDDGQGNTWKPASPHKHIETAAVDFIIEKVLQFPNEIIIAAIGPLTNLAELLEVKPEIQYLVKEIIMMGGNAFCAGNATPSAEANILSDPDAADIVLGAAWPITMIGLDVTHKVVLHKSDIDELAMHESDINRHVSEAYRFYLDFYIRVNKMHGTYLHDSSVIAFLLNRKLFKTVKYPVRIETTECISKGKTWPSVGDTDHEGGPALIPWKKRPAINICVDVDGEAVIRQLKQKLLNSNSISK